jgi:hypothetical protein
LWGLLFHAVLDELPLQGRHLLALVSASLGTVAALVILALLVPSVLVAV